MVVKFYLQIMDVQNSNLNVMNRNAKNVSRILVCFSALLTIRTISKVTSYYRKKYVFNV